MLVVGEPQKLPQPIGIFLDHDGERRQAPDRDRIAPVKSRHPTEAPEFGGTAEEPCEEAVIGQDADRVLGPPGDEEPQKFVPDPLLRQDRQSLPLGT